MARLIMPFWDAKYLALFWACVNLPLADRAYLAWRLALDALPLALAAYLALLLTRSILRLSDSVWFELPVSETPTFSDRRDMGTPETNDSVALNFTVSVRICCRVYSANGSTVATQLSDGLAC